MFFSHFCSYFIIKFACTFSWRYITFSHDNIAHTILGKLNVVTSVYQEEKDIFSACQSSHTVAKVTAIESKVAIN